MCVSRGTEAGIGLPVGLLGFSCTRTGGAGNAVGGAGTCLNDLLETSALFLYLEDVWLLEFVITDSVDKEMVQNIFLAVGQSKGKECHLTRKKHINIKVAIRGEGEGIIPRF